MTEESKVQGATPHIFNDEPVRGGEKAYFQFEAYANTMARLIAAKSTRTPLTVGIFGEWGTGKTTLMQAIQARLQETEKLGRKGAKIPFLSPAEHGDYRRCRTVWFNAWKYSGRPEESLVALIQAILRQMRDDGFINKVYAALSQPARPQLRVAEASLHILSQIFSAGQVEIDLSKFETQSRFQQHLPFLDEFQVLFDRLLLWYLRRGIKGEPDLSEATPQQRAQLDQEGVLVIFIDDLDRCLPSKTVQVLEAIKLMIGRPGTVFVLGASERVVQEAIRTHYLQVEKMEREETDCQQYLEKLIQVRFPLPPLRPEDVQTFVSELLQGRPEEEVATLRQNLPLIAVGVPTNPRRLKTFVNFVELQWAFLVNSGQAAGLSKDVLTRWLVLDAAEPEFTKFVRELPPTVYVDRQPIDGRLRFVQNALRLTRGEKVDTAAEYDRWPKERCRRLWELLSQKGFTFDLQPGELDRLIHLSAPPVQAVPEEKAPPAAPEAARPARERPEKFPAGRERTEWLPALVRVPAGPFLMGSDKKQDHDAYDDELPQHLEKSINRSYLIGSYPVTNAEFARFVQATGYQTAAEKPGAKGGYVWVGTEWKQVEGANWQHPEGPHSSIEGLLDHPVVQVTWHDALAYCAWLTERRADLGLIIYGLSDSDLQSAIENHQFVVRLPTEAEWEKAARGEDGRIWPWGNQFDPKKCNSSEGGVGQTTPVGHYSPAGDSPYGCADMAGNVWEWCQSKWLENYQHYDRGIPERESLEGSDRRVLRGGSWDDDQRLARCAFRYRDGPGGFADDVGFRVVFSPN